MNRLSRLLGLSLPALLLVGCASQPASVVRHAPPPAPLPSVMPERFSPVAEDVLFRAIGLVGTPYRWGGNTPDSGFDCSGLISYVYRESAGIQLPRTTAAMSEMKVPRVKREQLRSGDLVFFATDGGRRVSHAGIYVGEGRFVHAPRTGGTVRLDHLSNSYWQKAYLDARRVMPAASNLARNP